jgi:hyperosmotically inducible periplasmic protein
MTHSEKASRSTSKHFRAVLLAALAAVGFSAWAAGSGGASGKQPASDFKQDIHNAHVELAVHLKLLSKLGVDGLHVEVVAQDGNVTLSGIVKHPADQKMARQVALSVDGVKSVRNEITYVPDKQNTDSAVKKTAHKVERPVKDAALEAHVKMRLLDNMGHNAFDVEVEASRGVVSLRGVVKTDSYRDTAVQTARGTKGVRKVIDLLKVGG